MKYDEKYPNAKVHDEPELCILRIDGERPCDVCNDLTHWAEINFLASICSEECNEKLTREYVEASMQ